MRGRVRSRLRPDAYRGRGRMPSGVTLGRDRRRAFRAMGLRRVRDQRRDPMSSLLSSSMPDRARMHAANLPNRSQRNLAARTCVTRRFAMNWRMLGLEGVPLRRGGWILFLLDYDARFSEELRESLIDSAFGAIDGTLKKRIRRSRHAETWAQHLGSGGGPDVYFKVIDAAHGAHAMKLLFKGSRAAHVARISERLRADGIGVPEILLLGAEQRGGREIVVTARVDGRNVPRYLRSERDPLAAKRAILRALGAEVARLHRAGYLHGDLTPYNIFVTGVNPPQVVFIDHDRTGRPLLGHFERPRMRNLFR